MTFKTKVITNCYWKPTKRFYDWAALNVDWVLPVNANINEPSSCMLNLKDIDEKMSVLNWTLNEVATILGVYHNLRVLPGDTQYIGLQNYRRTFDREQLNNALQDHPDAIVSCPILLGAYGNPVQLKEQYKIMHVKEDFDLLLNILAQQSWTDLNLLCQWNQLGVLPAPCNSFVMAREEFNLFCSRLEEVMTQLLDEIGLVNIAKRDAYQRRAGAFLAERFTSFYLYSMMLSNGRVKTVGLEMQEDFAEKQPEVDKDGTVRSK